jgi:hypothetical protein
MATQSSQTMTPADVKAWTMLASYVQTRPRLSWLWLTDELVIMSIVSTKGNGLSQERCWETIAFFDFDAGRAYFPEQYCFDSQRKSIDAAEDIIAEARAAGSGDPLDEVVPLLRVIPDCPL